MHDDASRRWDRVRRFIDAVIPPEPPVNDEQLDVLGDEGEACGGERPGEAGEAPLT